MNIKGTLVGYLRRVPPFPCFVDPVFELENGVMVCQYINESGEVSDVSPVKSKENVVLNPEEHAVDLTNIGESEENLAIAEVPFEIDSSPLALGLHPVFGFKWTEGLVSFGQRAELAGILMQHYQIFDDNAYLQGQVLEFVLKLPRSETKLFPHLDTPLMARMYEDYTHNLSVAQRVKLAGMRRYVPTESFELNNSARAMFDALWFIADQDPINLLIVSNGLVGRHLLIGLSASYEWINGTRRVAWDYSIDNQVQRSFLGDFRSSMTREMDRAIVAVLADPDAIDKWSFGDELLSMRRERNLPVVDIFEAVKLHLSPWRDNTTTVTAEGKLKKSFAWRAPHERGLLSDSAMDLVVRWGFSSLAVSSDTKVFTKVASTPQNIKKDHH